jgi:ribose-phosphate pyrophosphokinase
MQGNFLFLGSKAQHFKNLNARVVPYTFKQYNDGEISFKIDADLYEKVVTIIHSTSAPTNDQVIELLIMVDAIKNFFPKKIKLIMPYFGYSRQDRFMAAGTSISAKVIANLIGRSGVNELTVLDLHTPQQVGFFPMPVKHLSAVPLFANYIKENLDNAVIVSPDIGGVKRAETLSDLTKLPLNIINKKRNDDGNIIQSTLIGHVKGKQCVLLDDMIDSGETLKTAAALLLNEGADCVHAFATHGVFSKKVDFTTSAIKCVHVTDSIHHENLPDRVDILSIHDLLQYQVNDNAS